MLDGLFIFADGLYCRYRVIGLCLYLHVNFIIIILIIVIIMKIIVGFHFKLSYYDFLTLFYVIYFIVFISHFLIIIKYRF